MTYGNDANIVSNIVYHYDIADKLTRITNNMYTGSIDIRYADYDKVSNRRSMKVNDANTQTYTYDDLYQLIYVDYNNGNTTNYYYDPLGNRTRETNGSTTDYSSNNVNQYTSVNSVAYSYDLNGNLIYDGQFTYVYDCENRLMEVKQGTTTIATYAYDYRGRRVRKTVGAVVTKYCYDGDEAIADYENGDLVRKYICGPGIDEPIMMVVVNGSETRYYYHYDGLGSVVALSNNSGGLTEQYSYDVFGMPNTTSAVGNPYLFTARAYDSETGLYYYRARYYKPSIGRFLQSDPIGYRGGLNLYMYCGNNPIRFVDPMGLDVWVGKSGLGGWHHSINVGNPKGSYRSWSFRLKGNSFGQLANNYNNPFSKDFRTGEVYEDVGSNSVYKDKYLKTTPEFDDMAEAGLDNVVGTEDGYDLWSNCWDFSDEMFDALKDLFDSLPKTEPTEPDAPENPNNKKGSET